MDAEIKSKLINRVKENPYFNHLGIEFTSIEEGKVEAISPVKRGYSAPIYFAITR